VTLGVGDRTLFNLELTRPPVSRLMAKREIAIDAVPLTGEANGELLDYIGSSVGMYGEQRAEIADANVAALRGRADWSDRAKEQRE
jgi:hypothetical protein